MATNIQTIKNFPALIKYLRTELGWPVDEEQADNLTFDYDPDALGLDAAAAVKVRAAKQLRPLVAGQPWGIFWIDFEPKKLPITVMRRILNQLVAKKRGGKSNQATWNLDDLLFISAVGSEKSDQREITFAHFHQEEGDLPTLRVLGWDGADTVLKIDYVVKTLKEKLLWPSNPKDVKAWRETWAEAFKHKPGHVIKTADALAARLAELASNIRAAAETIMLHETEKGQLRRLHKAFQTALIHDLTEESFADTYAQTITYGLLTAAISRTDMSGGSFGTALVAENITDMVPVTNPFLKEMLETFLYAGGRRGDKRARGGGIDFDELGIQDVVELLRSDETDLPAILRDFNNRTEGEDPVIRFYEDFLEAYDKELKVQRGVFYTPKPVVSYIVRGVHELLQSEFGLEDGLAATVTWGEMHVRNAEVKIPKGVSPNSFFVVILDPATGTATFLVEVIDVIYKTMVAKWKKQGYKESQIQAAWNEYVPTSLLPRLYGYELMMAPYAIAHMKIGLKLGETRYRFTSNQRANIYLTNALEEPSQLAENSAASLFEALGHEAHAVNHVKRNIHPTVIIGNPPYSKASQNLGDNFKKHIERFRFFEGERIREPGAILFERDINNDYVKFLGYSRLTVDTVGVGIFSMITSNSYLDGKNFRGVRDAFKESFSSILVFNLHGNSRSGELARLGIKDENVFEIETGVCILFGIKKSRATQPENFAYTEITGTYDDKYIHLIAEKLLSTLHNWTKSKLDTRRYLSFIPSKSSNIDTYSKMTQLDKLFTMGVDGIKTSRDGLVIANSVFECGEKIQRFANLNSEKEIYNLFSISLDNWDYKPAQKYLKKNYAPSRIFKVAYRPFDFRYIYYDPEIIFSPRDKMTHMIKGENVALVCASRLSAKGFDNILPADCLVEMKYASHDTNSRVFPVYLYNNDSMFGSTKDNNITKVNAYYVFAMLNSQIYREKFFDEIKNDFPAIPIAENDVQDALSVIGEKLINVQLFKKEIPKEKFVFHGRVGNEVITPSYSDGKLYLTDSGYFDNIDSSVYDFHLAGYHVCKSWATAGNKSGIQRKGTPLSIDYLRDFRFLLNAITETIRIRKEIDKIVSETWSW